jgi:hypothetical protein
LYIDPTKAHTPLIVDANAVLSGPVSPAQPSSERADDQRWY